MNHIRRGIAITDLLALAAILLLIAAIGVPTLERARELSKRAVCAVNLKALGGAAEIYADANKGRWMTPAFRERTVNEEGIMYLCLGPDSDDIACVGFARNRESTSETMQHPAAGTTALSTTRAYWMLVRSGNVSAKQFVCPSSVEDHADPTTNIDLYYDFTAYRNISYGYLVPVGPLETRPRQGKDHRMVFAADKGPNYHNIMVDPYTAGPNGTVLQLDHDPSYWRWFNSPNHGGWGNSQGQNALFADGRVEFHRIPAIGLDNDNIYSVIADYWGPLPFNRIHGSPPQQSSLGSPFPGQGTFGSGPDEFSTTDSLIFP